jgi:hypothetical protein
MRIMGGPESVDQLAGTPTGPEVEMHEHFPEIKAKFGKLSGDIYTADGGVFRVTIPDFTKDMCDSENGVAFSDMAGGFWIIEYYEISEGEIPPADPAAIRRLLEAGIRDVVVPRRIVPAFGEPTLNDFRFLNTPEDPTCYVDGMIGGGADFAEFSPDGTSESLNLRFGLLAVLRGRRVFIFMRGANTFLGYEGDHDFEGLQSKLVTFAAAVESDVDEDEPIAEKRREAELRKYLRKEEERERAMEPRRRAGKEIKAAIDRLGITCPHCAVHTKNVRYYDDGAYFVCRECARSFTPDDLEGSEVFPK